MEKALLRQLLKDSYPWLFFIGVMLILYRYLTPEFYPLKKLFLILGIIFLLFGILFIVIIKKKLN